jgi:hypothetical protein
MAKKYNNQRGIIKDHSKKNNSLAVLMVVLGVVAILFVSEATNTTHLFHSSTPPPVIPTTNSTQSNTPTKSTSSTAAPPTKNDKNSNSSNPTKLPLYTPYGNFVSNHHPGENGSPTSESSVCNTTPGATCYIRFTQGSTTTSLPAKKTNSDGAVYWSWDTKTANLTSGDWAITAIATLNGQTKTTKDNIPLTIK